jgi:hypothetical protein
VVLLLLYAFSEPLFEFASQQGLCSASSEKRICTGYLGYLIGPGVLPYIFVSGFVAPFSGYGGAFSAVVSPVTYVLSLLAMNFWVWQLRGAYRGGGA